MSNKNRMSIEEASASWDAECKDLVCKYNGLNDALPMLDINKDLLSTQVVKSVLTVFALNNIPFQYINKTENMVLGGVQAELAIGKDYAVQIAWLVKMVLAEHGINYCLTVSTRPEMMGSEAMQEFNNVSWI